MAKQRTVTGRKDTLTAQQRMRRASGVIVRIEISLNNKSGRDMMISDYLDTLQGQTKADFFRAALAEKILRETTQETSSPAVAELEELYRMLSERDDMIRTLHGMLEQISAQLTDLQMRPITVAQTIMPQAPVATTVSSGLDLDTGRRRKSSHTVIAPVEPETNDYDRGDLAATLLAGIRSFEAV